MNPGEWRFETPDGWKSVNLKETEGGFIEVEAAGARYATASSTPIGAIHASCRHAFGIQPWEIWEIRGPGEPTYEEVRRENSDLHGRVNALAEEVCRLLGVLRAL